MRLNHVLNSSTGLCSLLAILVASPATAQVAPVSTDSDAEAEIIVRGVRGSVEAAARQKQEAKQIVDSVVAEDVGKLPDNNVPEALSRITGVQIDRARGQGQGVSIRGLSEVQTTINGNNTNLGDGRSVSLADIPAELLKQVDVYKTRSADQVEGGIAGTVNVELRRPFDLKPGWTVAGSVRGSLDDISDKVSPYASVLVANRFDTAIGEIGVLVNGSWTRTIYRENYIESESPSVPCCAGDPNSVLYSLPEDMRDTVIPYRAYYGLEAGNVRRPSINAVLQWRASDELEFVLEGGYVGSREQRQLDRMYLQTREGGYQFSNLQLMPDGRTIRSMTVTNPAGLAAGIDYQYNTLHSDLYTTNLEGNWTTDDVQLHGSMQYNWSREGSYFVQTILRPGAVTSASIDFASDIYSQGAPAITLGGADLADPSTYLVDRFQDNQGGSRNREFSAQLDLTVPISPDGLLRNVQVGGRFNQRKLRRYYGYRDGFPRIDGQRAPLSTFPGAETAALTGPEFDNTPQWYRIPGDVLLENVAAIREYIQQYDPANAARFESVYPPSDQGQTFRSTERNYAGYAQLNYGFDLGTIEVEGLAGARLTHTKGHSLSFNFRPGDESTDFRDIVQESPGSGSYTDVLPTATAIIRFEPETQLRLSYSTNVQRPGFYDSRPFFFAETRSVPPVIFAGNPELEAQNEWALDASAEHYFGRGGQISFAGYYKKATGFLYYSREQVGAEEMLQYGVDLADYDSDFGYVEQLRNAGDGTFIGIEGTVQSFFDFLPGALADFGVSLNASHIIKARIEYPYPEDFPGAFDSPNTSKWTANAALFYDTNQFSVRVAYNYRSSYRMGIWQDTPEYSPYNDATERLDAAINYTPVPFMTLSLEASNILGNDVYRYHGSEALLPLGVRTLARTVQSSIRFRF